MQSLDTGESPIITVRVAPELKRRVVAAFPTRGTRSEWLRRVIELALENEETPADDGGLSGVGAQTPNRDEGTR